MSDEFGRLAEVATGQHGSVTARQIGDAGISTGQRRRQMEIGALERTGSHTFRSRFAPRSPLADLAAVVLDCAPDGVASGPSAAALHRFDGISLRPPFHVTVLRGRNVQRAHHCVHTTTVLPPNDRVVVNGIAVMSATRTLIDLARFVRPSTLTAALDSALRDRLTTEDVLHRRIVELRSSGRIGIPKLLAVIEGCEASRGGHSWLERRFLELCESAGLPRPGTQVELARAGGRVVRVDCRFPGTAVVVELLGYRWHRTKDQIARDTERLNALLLEGLVPMQFTYDQVTVQPAAVVTALRRALGHGFMSPDRSPGTNPVT